jgi:transposase
MVGKVAGIDVHKKVLMVVVIDADTPAAKPERRRFTTMPSELCRLSMWLKEYGVEEAVMESTAQYWRPVWLELEPGLGIDSAQQIIAEVGGTSGTFPSAAEFTSWVGTCPGKQESAEENSSSRSAKGNKYMTPCAQPSR